MYVPFLHHFTFSLISSQKYINVEVIFKKTKSRLTVIQNCSVVNLSRSCSPEQSMQSATNPLFRVVVSVNEFVFRRVFEKFAQNRRIERYTSR
jgi:hypothetical protein